MKKKLNNIMWKILTILAVIASIGMGSGQVFAGEPEVKLVEGNIGNLNMRSGYLIMSEKKILFDSETIVQNQKEEPLNIRDLKEGMPVSVFFENRRFSNKALLITLHLKPSKKPKSR